MTEIKKIELSSQTLYELAKNEFSKIKRYLTERDYEIIYKAPYTYIVKDGKMWFSKCMECDFFSSAEGLFVAFYKMRGWDLPLTYKKCKISDLKSGDKFKIILGADYFYTYDVKSNYYDNVIFCVFNRDNSMERFDGDTTVLKIN